MEDDIGALIYKESQLRKAEAAAAAAVAALAAEKVENNSSMTHHRTSTRKRSTTLVVVTSLTPKVVQREDIARKVKRKSVEQKNDQGMNTVTKKKQK